MKFLAQGADPLRVARKLLLVPSVGNGLQKRDQRGGRRWNHALQNALLDQSWILLERGAKKCFAGKEHHDELGRSFELLPIVLAAEDLHVIADLPCMAGQAGSPRFFVWGFEGVEKG